MREITEVMESFCTLIIWLSTCDEMTELNTHIPMSIGCFGILIQLCKMQAPGRRSEVYMGPLCLVFILPCGFIIMSKEKL